MANYDCSHNQCKTGKPFCCHSVQKASSPQASKIIDTLAGADIPADADVGLTCAPITALDIEKNSWYVCTSIASEVS